MNMKTSGRKIGPYEVRLTGQGRQFENKLMDKLGRCHGLAPLFIYVPVIVFLWYMAATDTAAGTGAIIGWSAAGFAFWTFSEYWLHREIFHLDRFWTFHWRMHGIHHGYPNDTGRLVFPPAPSLAFASAFWGLFYLVAGYAVALPLMAGFLVGYLTYDMTHLWTHVGKPKSRWGKMLRRNHMLHHFHDHTKRFGVSSPLWDIVFRTYGSPADRLPKE